MKRVGKYDDFVEHPRFGRAPRFTGVRPGPMPPGYRRTTYRTVGLIEGTAVAADLVRQSYSPVPVLYYFDLERTCINCGRFFLFFGVEQKHWYETLGFSLDADCVRCTDCRKKEHSLKGQARRYAELLCIENRSVEENLELAEHCLSLIEAGMFDQRKVELVRMLLNRIPKDRNKRIEHRFGDIRLQLRSVEAKNTA